MFLLKGQRSECHLILDQNAIAITPVTTWTLSYRYLRSCETCPGREYDQFCSLLTEQPFAPIEWQLLRRRRAQQGLCLFPSIDRLSFVSGRYPDKQVPCTPAYSCTVASPYFQPARPVFGPAHTRLLRGLLALEIKGFVGGGWLVSAYCD